MVFIRSAANFDTLEHLRYWAEFDFTLKQLIKVFSLRFHKLWGLALSKRRYFLASMRSAIQDFMP